MTLAWEEYEKDKWDHIAIKMQAYGCPEKWSKEAVQRKWLDLHPEYDPYYCEYEVAGSRSQEQGAYDVKDEPRSGWGDDNSSGFTEALRSREYEDSGIGGGGGGGSGPHLPQMFPSHEEIWNGS